MQPSALVYAIIEIVGSAAPTPVALEGGWVRLEPLSRDHLDAMFSIGMDPDLWRWIPMRMTSRDDMAKYIETAVAGQQRAEMLPFATIYRPTGEVVGSTRYGNIDVPNRRLEIGWTWVTKEFQRTAVNTEAKFLLLRHAFEVLHYNRVEFKTDALNQRSRNAILRLGARKRECFANT